MLELSDHKSSYRFEYPKEFLLNQATQKSTRQNFQPPKILKLKISNPKKSFDHPCHLKSRVPPPPPPPPPRPSWVCTKVILLWYLLP